MTYSGGGATGGNTPSSIHAYDKETALTPNGFVRQYTVTYNYTGSGADSSTDTAKYVFAGWLSEDGTKYADKASVLNLKSENGATLAMTAQWTSASVTLPNPTRTGYQFAGWYADANYTKKIGDAGAAYTPENEITLYAKWEARTYTVLYNPNGGQLNAGQSSDTKTYDSAYGTLPTPTREGYAFTGWTYNGKTVLEKSIVKVAGTHVLTANWIEASGTITSGARTEVIGEGEKFEEYINPSLNVKKLESLGYTKLKVSVTFDARVVHSCYQRIIAYSRDTGKQFYGKDWDISEDGWQTGKSFAFEIKIDECQENGSFWMRWECPDSNWRDQWELGSTSITVTAVK